MGSVERFIIFTDLDGTLIDFETYSPEIATPTVKQLLAADVPVVFCSSKTIAEQQALMDEMGIVTPCIVENGSGIFVPNGFELKLGAKQSSKVENGRLAQLGIGSESILETIGIVSQELGIAFKPYSEMSIDQVAEITGLSPQGARFARDRDFSETLTVQLEDEVWDQVRKEFAKHGLQCVCGGRFHTVTAKGCDKGKALKLMVDAFRKAEPATWTSIALGDSANDEAMLKVADIPCLVQRPAGDWFPMDLPRLATIDGVGPRGWVEAVKRFVPLSE